VLPTDLDWMSLRMEAIYRHDDAGRLLTRREPGSPAAARFHLARTRHGNLWRIRADQPSRVVQRLSRLAGKEAALRLDELPPPPPERAQSIRDSLVAGGEIRAEWCGPAHRFPDRSELWGSLREMARQVQMVDPSEAGVLALLCRDFPELEGTLAQRQPCFAVIESERVRSVCYSACTAPKGAAEAGVETRAEDRGRGLAARCVAAWALAIREHGGLPLYSTSWSNRSSRAVAKKLGLELFGEDWHLR